MNVTKYNNVIKEKFSIFPHISLLKAVTGESLPFLFVRNIVTIIIKQVVFIIATMVLTF